MKYDEVLELVGPIGRYQKIILFALVGVTFQTNFPSLIFVFLGAIPRHWCYVPEVDEFNLTQSEVQNLTLPWETKDGVWTYKSCQAYSCPDWTTVINVSLVELYSQTCPL